MNASCPYAALNLPFAASEQDIRRAYANGLARIRASIGERKVPEQLDAMRSAYKLLSDPVRRRHYDETRLARAAVPQAAATRDAEVGPVNFEGSGLAYFRIWIVNLLLTLLTLGIYSAWAKVRREQYLHRRLRLAGATFDYHGRPLAILKGRLLLAVLLVVYSLTRFMPFGLHALVIIGAVLLFPWMIQRSLQFRAANTSYRGLRFSFSGSYREALVAYLGYGLLAVLTLGLALPLLMWRQKKFVIANLGYGRDVFSFGATPAMFYRALWLPTLVIFLPCGGLLLALSMGGKALLVKFVTLGMLKLLAPLFVVLLFTMQLFVLPYARMKSLNVAWSNSRLHDVGIVCEQGFAGYGATHASNWLLTLLSFGLFWPWAVVRMLRYRCRHFSVAAQGSLDQFLAARAQSPSALGGEAAASFDLDVGL